MYFDGKSDREKVHVSQCYQKKLETKEQFLNKHKKEKVQQAMNKQQEAAASKIKLFFSRLYFSTGIF